MNARDKGPRRILWAYNSSESRADLRLRQRLADDFSSDNWPNSLSAKNLPSLKFYFGEEDTDKNSLTQSLTTMIGGIFEIIRCHGEEDNSRYSHDSVASDLRQ